MYCSPECQNEHWKVHKRSCKDKAKRAEDPNKSAKSVTNVKWLLCGSHFRQQLQTCSRQPGLSDQPMVGLRNQGNTCYLNAILQCLVHTTLLSQLVQDVPSQCLRKQDSRQWLAELQHLFLDNKDSFSSCGASAIAELITTNKEFLRGRQADAHEAFMFIMERLLDACLVVGDGQRDTTAELFKSSYAEKERLERSSLIGHVFGMDIGQTVRCRHCSYSSETTRVEYCLCLSCTLDLDENEREKLQRQSWRYGMKAEALPQTTLDELLKQYARVEPLEGYRCEKCSRTGCVRSACIKRRPNIFAVYINRRQDLSQFGKINRDVQFPQSLDLTPILEAADSSNYKLYGVVVHKDYNGSTAFGHYIAFVKGQTGWHKMDDEHVSQVPWSSVKEQRADLLLYAAEYVCLPPGDNADSEKKPVSREHRAASRPLQPEPSPPEPWAGPGPAGPGPGPPRPGPPRLGDQEGCGTAPVSLPSPRLGVEPNTAPVEDTHARQNMQIEHRQPQQEVKPNDEARASPKNSGSFFDFDELDELEEQRARENGV